MEIFILIVSAILMSAMLSYCAAYYRASYLFKEAKQSSYKGSSSKKDKEKSGAAEEKSEKSEEKDVTEDSKTDDSSKDCEKEESKEEKDVTKESKTDDSSKACEKKKDKEEKKEDENTSASETKESDKAADDKESSKLAAKISITKPAPFFQIKDNILNLKKSIIMFFSVFSILAAAIILIQYDKATAVKAIQYILYSDCLFLIAAIDFQVKKIPNKLILLLLCLRIVAILSEFLFDGKELYTLLLFSAIGMAVGAISVFTCMLVSRGGIGAGDLKMFSVIGLYFGLQGLMEIMIYSLFLASIVGIILLISKKAKFKSSLAMAPFMFIGSMLRILMI